MKGARIKHREHPKYEFYFEVRPAKLCKNMLKMTQIATKRIPQMKNTGRVYMLRATSAASLTYWIKGITAAIEAANSKDINNSFFMSTASNYPETTRSAGSVLHDTEYRLEKRVRFAEDLATTADFLPPAPNSSEFLWCLCIRSCACLIHCIFV